MSSLHQQAGVAQSNCKLLLDPLGLSPGDALQMQRRTGKHFESTFEHTAGGADARLVLIESLGGRVFAHPYVDAVGAAAAIAVVEQHQIDVRSSLAPRLESAGDFVRDRQPLDVPHRQPLGYRASRGLPQALELRVDVRTELTSHPELVDAVRADRAVCGRQSRREAAADIRAAQRTKRP